jgi:hypothetical protein
MATEEPREERGNDMRHGRFLAACLAATLILLLFAAPAFAGKMPTNNIPYSVNDMLKGAKAPKQLKPAEAKAAILAQGEPILHDGREPDLYLTLYDWDPAHAGPHVVPFWKEFIGTHSDVYVGWNDLTPPPTSSQQNHTITKMQTDYMGGEFDQRIWPSDVFHFGWYKPRVPVSLPPGEAAKYDGSRAAIMVYNIRDEAYWSSYRFYIAGYFWGGLNDELGINAIFIDSYDWANRIGPDSARPYLYEGTIAHEFQPLIHSHVDGDEDSFIDVGMADLAEQFIYGTKTTDSHIGEYLYYHRDSLIDWKGELFDYGNSVLWQDYLWENAGGDKLSSGSDPLEGRVAKHFDAFDDTADKFTDPGDKFTWNLIHDQDNGLASVANWVGGMDKVEELHHDYTLANLLDGKVTEAKWNYRNLALGGSDSAFMTVDQGIQYYSSRVRGNMPPTRKNVRRRTITEAWGAYYRTFAGPEPGFTMKFTGSTQDGVLPFSAPTEWYAGLGNGLQRTLERTISGVPAGATLDFKTWYDIEEDWDYGYVEASTDGQTWTKLPQKTTLRAGVSNVFGSSAWDGAGGLTGNSGGWQSASFDLTGFTGDVKVRFRYATDEASNGQGWYVDDIAVGSVFSDPVDSVNGWTTNGWVFTTGLQNNDWTADAFVAYAKDRRTWYSVKPIVPVAGTGSAGSAYITAQYLKSGKAYGVVSNRPRDGVFDATGMLTIAKGK